MKTTKICKILFIPALLFVWSCAQSENAPLSPGRVDAKTFYSAYLPQAYEGLLTWVEIHLACRKSPADSCLASVDEVEKLGSYWEELQKEQWSFGRRQIDHSEAIFASPEAAEGALHGARNFSRAMLYQFHLDAFSRIRATLGACNLKEETYTDNLKRVQAGVLNDFWGMKAPKVLLAEKEIGARSELYIQQFTNDTIPGRCKELTDLGLKILVAIDVEALGRGKVVVSQQDEKVKWTYTAANIVAMAIVINDWRPKD